MTPRTVPPTLDLPKRRRFVSTVTSTSLILDWITLTCISTVQPYAVARMFRFRRVSARIALKGPRSVTGYPHNNRIIRLAT